MLGEPKTSESTTAETASDAQTAESLGNDKIVDATLATEPLRPFAFSMQALLWLTAISGGQFALISYWGSLGGLLAGIALCVAAMAGLIVTTVVLGLRPGSNLLVLLDRIAIRLVVGIVVLFLGTIIAGGGQIVYVATSDMRARWQRQSELGFVYQEHSRYSEAMPNDANALLEVTSVTAGYAIDQAGIQAGDVILLDNSAEQFFAKIDEQRGQTIEVTIANFTPSSGKQELDEANQRVVTLHVPP